MLEVKENNNWSTILISLITLVYKKMEGEHWLSNLINNLDRQYLESYRFLDYNTFLNIYLHFKTKPLPESFLLNEFHRDLYLARTLSNYLLEKSLDPSKATSDLENALVKNKISRAEISIFLKIKIPRLIRYRSDYPENHTDFTYNQIQNALSEYLKKHSTSEFKIIIGILISIINLESQIDHVPKSIFRLDPRLYKLVPRYLLAISTISNCKDLDIIKIVLSTSFPDISITDFSIFIETYLPKILEDYIKPDKFG